MPCGLPDSNQPTKPNQIISFSYCVINRKNTVGFAESIVAVTPLTVPPG